jgi:serine/threonine protein kinase
LLITEKNINRRTAETIGTLNWAAPEILKEEPEWSKKADIFFFPSQIIYLFVLDIYSLGMVFYEIISREIPFKSDTNLYVLHKKIKSGILPTIPKDCPPVLPHPCTI